jgi:hypothetical protein
MTQVSKPVQMLLVDEVCDNCGKGMMRPNGNNMITANPPQFEHKCTECDHTAAYPQSFPTTGFRTIPEVEEEIKALHDAKNAEDNKTDPE